MILTKTRRLLAGAVVAMVFLAATQDADAFWWRGHNSSGGSSGSWGSCGSSGSWGSSGSSGGSWGNHHSWHRHHRVYYSQGSCGSSGSWGSWGSSGSWGSHGSNGGHYRAVPQTAPGSPVPMEQPVPTEPAPPEAPIPPELPDGEPTSNDAALTVEVPENAQVFVNGRTTTSTGNIRTYISRGLSPRFRYTYEVRAAVIRDGEKLQEVKTVDLRAGQSARLAFDLNPRPVETSITLNVPQDAKVYLSGVATKATGNVRTFKTTKLNSGKSWSDYTIKVTLDLDGHTFTKEQTIELNAGEDRELTFSFDAPKIADAR